MVNALAIWERLCKDICEEAVRFYVALSDSSMKECQWEELEDRKRKGEFSELAKMVLEQGSTNFDEKHCPNDPNEKPRYKTDFYIWHSMDMHLKQNLAVLGHTCKIR